MLQRQSSQAQATRRAWAIQNGREDDSDVPSSPTSSEFSDDGAPPSPAASDRTKAATPPFSPATPPRSPTPAVPTSASPSPAVRKNSLKATPKSSPKSLKSKAARKTEKAARPAPLKLTKSAFDTSTNLPSTTSDASSSSDAPQRKKEVSIRPNSTPTMSDEEAADALFRLISDAWRQHDSCSAASEASSQLSEVSSSSSSFGDTNSQPLFHCQLPAPLFGDVYYPTPGPEKSFQGFGAYQCQSYEALAYDRRDSLESATSATSAASANIMTPPVTPVLYASNAAGKGHPPEGYGVDFVSGHLFAH